MIEIFVDGIQLEVPQDISIGLNLGIADYTDPISASGAYTQTVEIPRTPHNDKAFKFAGEVLSADAYNHTEHTARVVEDGCELVNSFEERYERSRCFKNIYNKIAKEIETELF